MNDMMLMALTDPIYLICTGLALLWVILFGKHLIQGIQ